MNRLTAFLCVIAAAVAMPVSAQTELTEKFSRTSHLDPGGTFDLTNITGNIAVTGGTGRDVTIDATKRVQRPNANAGGQGYALTGHHEIMIPLLAAMLVDKDGK